jgi:hypothetical protein
MLFSYFTDFVVSFRWISFSYFTDFISFRWISFSYFTDFVSFRSISFSYFTDFVGFCFRFVSFRFFSFLSLPVPMSSNELSAVTSLWKRLFPNTNKDIFYFRSSWSSNSKPKNQFQQNTMGIAINKIKMLCKKHRKIELK